MTTGPKYTLLLSDDKETNIDLFSFRSVLTILVPVFLVFSLILNLNEYVVGNKNGSKQIERHKIRKLEKQSRIESLLRTGNTELVSDRSSEISTTTTSTIKQPTTDKPSTL